MAIELVPADTTEEADRVQRQIYASMTPSRRLELALQMSDYVREISACGVRDRHPDYTEAQVRLAVARLTLGDDLFKQVYPGVDIKV